MVGPYELYSPFQGGTHDSCTLEQTEPTSPLGEPLAGPQRQLWRGQPPQSDDRRVAPDALSLESHRAGGAGTSVEASQYASQDWVERTNRARHLDLAGGGARQLSRHPAMLVGAAGSPGRCGQDGAVGPDGLTASAVVDQ